MKKAILLLLLSIVWTQTIFSQTFPITVQVNYTANLGDASNPNNVIDNRNTSTRHNDSHGFCATGSGSWSVQEQYSDISSTGPWTSFGSEALVTQASGSCIGFGFGYHAWISFSVTGTATANYSGWQKFYVPAVAGSVSFPISVGQGGTGATTVSGALDSFGLSTSGVVIGLGSGNGIANVAAGSDLQYLRRKPNQTVPTYEFASLFAASSADYNFAAQKCNTSNVCSPTSTGGLTLLSSTPITVTLIPCPDGLNATDTLHSIYLSGGTGTAEAPPITGGTCSGGSTGTITFTPSNNHTGAWTITSSTSGIQEAANATGQGLIVIPGGFWNTYDTVRITTDLGILGAGPLSTTVEPHFTNGDAFYFYTPGGQNIFPVISGIYISLPVQATSGAIIDLASTNAGLVSDCLVNNITWYNAYNGIVVNNTDRCTISNVSSLLTVNYGIEMLNGGATVINAVMAGLGSSAEGLHIGTGFNGATVEQFSTQGGVYGIHAVCSTGVVNQLQATSLTFDSYTGTGIYFECPNGEAFNNVFTNIQISPSGTTGMGIDLYGSGVFSTTISNMNAFGVAIGLDCRGCSNSIVDASVLSCNGLASSYGIKITDTNSNGTGTPANRISIKNSNIGYDSTGGTGFGGGGPLNANACDIGVSPVFGGANETGIILSNNSLYGHTAAIDGQAASSVSTGSVWIWGNDGQIWPTINSAAAFYAPYFNNYFIAGATGITSVIGLPSGVNRNGQFIPTGSGLAFTAGSTIGNSCTTVVNNPYTWVWTGTKFYVSGKGC